MAMARLIFFSAVCVAFSRRQVEEASSVSLVEDASNTAIVFMDELDDMDDMDEEMITSVPVTPRRDPHDPRYELLGLDSSMMEITETTNETETCGTKGKPSYEITGKLGQGNWGAVYKVRTKTGRRYFKTQYQYFALKVPLAANPEAAAENVKEANIMGAVHCTWACVATCGEGTLCCSEWSAEYCFCDKVDARRLTEMVQAGQPIEEEQMHRRKFPMKSIPA